MYFSIKNTLKSYRDRTPKHTAVKADWENRREWIAVELLGQGPSYCLLEAKKYEHAVGSIEVNVIFLALLQLHRKMESKAL